MSIPFLTEFVARLRQRLHALLWGTLASDVETTAALDYADNLDRLEERARQYEEEGKGHLAQLLRQRAAAISLDAPGSTAVKAIAELSDEGCPEGTTSRLTFSPGADSSSNESTPCSSTAPAKEEPKSGRPRRRRRSTAGAD
jgi:hypothetical protein